MLICIISKRKKEKRIVFNKERRRYYQIVKMTMKGLWVNAIKTRFNLLTGDSVFVMGKGVMKIKLWRNADSKNHYQYQGNKPLYDALLTQKIIALKQASYSIATKLQNFHHSGNPQQKHKAAYDLFITVEVIRFFKIRSGSQAGTSFLVRFTFRSRKNNDRND